MEQSDSREELFDSSLKTVNVSVNTELPIDFSHGPKGEVSDNLHFYGEMDDDESHRMMSVDNLTHSTLFSDEVVDNREWHTNAGLETCDALKPTIHGNESLGKSIQSATDRGDSGIDNTAYLSGDDTKLGNDHTKADVYESSDNMLVSHSISENQNESDINLKDDILPDDEVYSDTDDGEYFSTDESLEGILDFGTFKSTPCTVVSFQEKHSLIALDPSAVLRSSEGEMFFPTTFLQYMKDKYENNGSYRKDLVTNTYGINTTSVRGSVEYAIAKGLIIRKDYKFLLCQHKFR